MAKQVFPGKKGLVLYALVAETPRDFEALPLSGQLPAHEGAWMTLTVRPTQPSDEDEAPPLSLLFPSDGTVPRGFGLKPERVAWKKAGERFTLRKQDFTVITHRESPSLAEALPLESDSVFSATDQILVGLEALDELARAVHANLMLSQGPVQLMTLRQDQGGDARYMLRLVSPSFFLIEEWMDAGHPVYRSTAQPSLWVKLGYRHPWERWLEEGVSLLKLDGTHLTMVEPEGWWLLPAEGFRDIFDSVQLAAETRSDITWAAAKKNPGFTVPMRWGFRATGVDAELWLLDEQDLQRLEHLIGVLADNDLKNLQLACLQDDDGEPVFVLRELIAGRSRQHLDLGGGFAAFAGFGNLLLPTDRHLDPPVRRDQYMRLFDLRSGILTVVIPTGGTNAMTPSEGMKVLTIPERSFRPLPSLVDYHVEGARTVLATVLERSVLDIGSLAQLPTRPAVAAPPPPPKERKRKKKRDSGDDLPDDDPDELEDPEDLEEIEVPDEDLIEVPDLEAIEVPQTPAQRSAAAEAEEALERKAVDALDAAELWRDLGSAKLRSGNIEQAVDALEHAIWVSSDASEPALQTHLSRAIEAATRARQVPEGLRVRGEVFDFVEAAEGASPAQLARLLPDVIGRLRVIGPQMSKKGRWLMWREVLTRTGDRVEIARLRETLLSELSLRGIEEQDSFPFIRRHVRNSVQSTELPPQVHQLLGVLSEHAGRIQSLDMRLESLGAVASALEDAGDAERSRDIVEKSFARLRELPSDRGAIAFASLGAAAAQLGLDEAEQLFDEGLARLGAMRDGFEKDQTLVAVLEELVSASLLSAEERLVQRLVDLIGQQQPRRQCLQLSDCAELLLDLGGASAVSERVEQLVHDAEVRADAYYLEHALRALVVVQSGRPPSAEIAEEVLEALVGTGSGLDDAGAKALDIAVTTLGASAIERLRQAATGADPLSALMYQSCVLRGLASQGQFDEGRALLSESMAAVWRLSDSNSITRALRRLIPNASHLGRGDEGVELVRQVLSELENRSNLQLSLRDRGEILATCALTVGKLGAQQRALELLGRIIETFEEMVKSRNQGVSHLFEILGLAVDQVIALGELEEGVGLVERAVRTITDRLNRATGADHPYFVHQSRIKCAVALLSFEQLDRGFELLDRSIRDIAQTNIFDGRDRVDLLIEAIRAMSIIGLDDAPRVGLLERLVEAGIGKESTSDFSDVLRRDMIRWTVRETIQRQTAYRLALKKIRALEERIIRMRIISERDLPAT